VIALLKRWLLGTHQGAIDSSIWTLTWTSSPFDSIAANPNLAANSSIDWLNKPCRSALFCFATLVKPQPVVYGGVK